MYIKQDVRRGYNAFTSIDVRNGEDTYMDVGLLIMEAGDTYAFEEEDKEVSWILMKGKGTAVIDGTSYEIERENPFDYSGYCLLMSKGSTCEITASEYSEFYVQKSLNDKTYEAKLYTPEETHTWARGTDGALDGMMRRDVRTYYDYETRPDSNMVLGEVVSPGGRWSSYPPHHHPQPEAYFYFFEDERGFGAGWSSGEVHELNHHGLLLVTDDTVHQQTVAPGYPCCYTWGIRHLPDNPWEKTRIDDEAHTWLLEDKPDYWRIPEDLEQ